MFETAAPLPAPARCRTLSDNFEGRNYGLWQLSGGPASPLSPSENAAGAGDSARVHNSGNDVRCAGSGTPAVALTSVRYDEPPFYWLEWTGSCRACGGRFAVGAVNGWKLPEHEAPATGVRS